MWRYRQALGVEILRPVIIPGRYRLRNGLNTQGVPAGSHWHWKPQSEVARYCRAICRES